MKKIHIVLLLALAIGARAQEHRIYDKNIASLTVMVGTDWQHIPITTLGGKAINIAFDELSHDYHRYTYTVEHCEADWTVSEDLFTSDYMDGFMTDNTIDNYELSAGTYQLYTHYELQIPNPQCRLTMSGNYRVKVFDDDEDNPVLCACFMVNEDAAGVSMGYTTNTDIDINATHQQLSMTVDYSNLRVSSPEQQLYVVVMQNQRRDNMVVNPRVTFRANNSLKWEHSEDLIFLAGNEYHKFETLDPSHATMGLESVGWDRMRSEWHAYVIPDEPARNYVYDVDADGCFLIRNSDNENVDTECDYVWTHFTLYAPREGGSVYVNGAWTYGQLTPEYEMTWNYDANCYEGAVYLKQGYYSYQYLAMDTDGRIHRLASEGNFFQTQNTYQALVYYKGNADRAWRLVGTGEIKTGG